MHEKINSTISTAENWWQTTELGSNQNTSELELHQPKAHTYIHSKQRFSYRGLRGTS